MMRKRIIAIWVISLLCFLPAVSVWAMAEDVVTEDAIEEEISEEAEELEGESGSEAEEMDETGEELSEMTEEAENQDTEDKPEVMDETTIQGEADDGWSREWEEDLDEEEYQTEMSDDSEEEEAVYYNVFCVDYGTEEILAVSDDEEFVGDEKISFEDILEEWEGEEVEESEIGGYGFHSAGIFYYMDADEFRNGLVPVFYDDTERFAEFDAEDYVFSFSEMPDKSVSIVFYAKPILATDTMTVDVEEIKEIKEMEEMEAMGEAVQVQEIELRQLIRPVMTGVVTDTVPYVALVLAGCLGSIGWIWMKRKGMI